MNTFEQKINALRIQFRNERISIQRDAERTIGHLNTAIGQVSIPEARELLRNERQRILETTRQHMICNRRCYLLQLEVLEAEYARHLEQNPSKRKRRRNNK